MASSPSDLQTEFEIMFTAIGNFLNHFLLSRNAISVRAALVPQTRPSLQAIGFTDFLNLDVPPREMLLNPILPERGLAMLYAPRGIGKTLLGLSMGLAIASGGLLLRWSASKPRRVLYVDGEMPLVSLQQRLRAISLGLGRGIPSEGFRILAADHTESGINLSTDEGQRSLEPLLNDTDLMILDNLSTLCTTGSESASDAWVPMQNWLLKLRRQGVAVLLIHHAGVNGRQRGTSRREDALDTVIALRRPEDYSPEQGARFEIHLEKLRNRADGAGAIPFEATLESFAIDGQDAIRWSSRNLIEPILKRAAQLFAEGFTVREVAAALRISKSEAGRLRLKALDDGLLGPDEGPELNNRQITVQ
jgi:putative DNA primase/helicase